MRIRARTHAANCNIVVRQRRNDNNNGGVVVVVYRRRQPSELKRSSYIGLIRVDLLRTEFPLTMCVCVRVGVCVCMKCRLFRKILCVNVCVEHIECAVGVNVW